MTGEIRVARRTIHVADVAGTALNPGLAWRPVAPDQATVAVLGAGNVGCALAADLVLRGVDVHLWNRSSGRLEPIRRAGGVRATGVVKGFAPLDRLTSSLEEAIGGAGIIAVTVPTPALPSLAPALADLTTADQLIWLDPGHSGGALFLAAEMARRLGRRGRRLCQLSTASHGCRMSGPTTAGVFNVPRARLAAFPGTAVTECLARIDASASRAVHVRGDRTGT